MFIHSILPIVSVSVLNLVICYEYRKRAKYMVSRLMHIVLLIKLYWIEHIIWKIVIYVNI